MSQITTGLRSILSSPWAYSAVQYLMGAKSGWSKLVKDYIKPKSNHRVLDIGCGPADILAYMPNEIEYWGFDISEKCIIKAKARGSKNARFFCKTLEEKDLENMPKFDKVLLIGVFHHLDNETASKVVKLARETLTEGGQMISIDPCYKSKQNPIARFLISKDRGQNVRDEIGYTKLVCNVFNHYDVELVDKVWIPYTHCYMVCTK